MTPTDTMRDGNLTPAGDKVGKVAQDDRDEGYARGIADPANRLAARMGCEFVPVTQEDREAAYWYVGAEYDQRQNDWAQHLRDGKQDDCPLVQAFAMHRACCALSDRQPDQRGGEVERLREALTSIHKARLHNGKDEGYGWDIGLLNRAMDVALPLIGQPRPERSSPEERAEMRKRFSALLDADHPAAAPRPAEQGEG